MSLLETGLTPWEHVRRHCHNDIDQCCDTWPVALLDAGCRGFPSAVMQPRTSGGGEEVDGEQISFTSVERAGNRPDFATAWIAELGDVLGLFGLPATPQRGGSWDASRVRVPWHRAAEELLSDWPPLAESATKRLSVLANMARAHWPAPVRRGQSVGGVVVGERGNQVEVCGLCGEPAPGGRNEAGQLLVRRIDGVAFHATAAGSLPACFWVVWRQRRAS